MKNITENIEKAAKWITGTLVVIGFSISMLLALIFQIYSFHTLQNQDITISITAMGLCMASLIVSFFIAGRFNS
jgi:hypothetical protein